MPKHRPPRRLSLGAIAIESFDTNNNEPDEQKRTDSIRVGPASHRARCCSFLFVSFVVVRVKSSSVAPIEWLAR